MADDPNAERPPDGRPSPTGPIDPLVVPRFAGPATFARLPRREDVDAATSPSWASRSTAASRTARAPGSGRTRSATPHGCSEPTTPVSTSSRSPAQQVADAGDIACNPFDISEAIVQIEAGADEMLGLIDAPALDRRRPHDRAAAAPRDAAAARPGRAPALRRPPRHVGHVLRRRATRTGRRSAARGRKASCSRTGPRTSGSAARCSRRTTS